MISNDEISSSMNRELSDIYDRNERINELVIIARQEYDKNKNYSEIIQVLHGVMTCSWKLSASTQKGYLNAVRTILQDNHGIKLQ
ncbi:MAG: hypothetical protein KGI28_10450, partial [Thaumarchaeota archaeon]|nr:hypothetical protein [Nitrososphaerota archaeon]